MMVVPIYGVCFEEKHSIRSIWFMVYSLNFFGVCVCVYMVSGPLDSIQQYYQGKID